MNMEQIINIRNMPKEERGFFMELIRKIPKNLGYNINDLHIRVNHSGINEDIIEFDVYFGDLCLRSWILGETHMTCYYENSSTLSPYYYIEPKTRLNLYRQFKDLNENKIYYSE